ncbi:hypothetical protein PaecuDRAFT_1035 [Paenibacillus curdlanolyticus YK9]|uniref:Peptidase S9 prolyl oligopeptidase catalytic domain-containing protein n=1 Tax=Paenibacillus curdlanolyticus YK9 TaxID=717606 RepID=E0I5W3_9BACL|nr:prolyl oligopeptidase family serine peptidase [Paenibacillus curdlanolyticus]EFM12355.1 hypothetical protein PaecuDRAFT_1035 [Paenibacillus curdlanolyticus YK9]
MSLEQETVRIQAAYAIGPVRNPFGNDRLNDDLSRIFNQDRICLEDRSSIALADGQIAECRFIDSVNNETKELDLNDYTLCENERLFLVTTLKTTEAKDVCVRTFDIIGKIWVNGELLFNKSGPFRFRLEPGEHLLVIEYFELRVNYSIRISDMAFELSNATELTEDYLSYWLDQRVQVVSESAYAVNSDLHAFYIFGADRLNVPNGTPVSVIVANDEGRTVDQFTACTGMRVEYDVRAISHETYCMLRFHLMYADAYGESRVTDHLALVHPIENVLSNLDRQYEQLVLNGFRNEIDNIQLLGLLNRIRAVAALEPAKVLVKQLRLVKEHWQEFVHACRLIEEGHRFEDTLIERRIGDGYYQSRLDDSLERYSIVLPDGYSSDKQYPLVILLPVCRYELDLPDVRAFFQDRMDEDAILVTFTCRGVTMGSYVGEASFLEGLDVIQQRYSIDEDRIYLSGYSNGAFAAWAIAQAYPDRFAGIAAYAGSASADKLLNLSNVAVLNVCGEFDYAIEASYKKPAAALGGYRYQGIIDPQATHWDTCYYHHLMYGIRWLLQQRRPEHPQRLHYRTDNARHRKCYWIDHITFAQEHPFGQLNAELKTDSLIQIDTLHIDSFEVTLPREAMAERLTIIIDGQSIKLQPNTSSQIRFQKSGDEGSCWQQEALISSKGPLAYASIGFGVLDIYMDRIKVVLPDRYDSLQEESIIQRVANLYARPKNNSWDPNIYVHYPIIAASELTAADIMQCNLIIIAGKMDNHGYLSMLHSQLSIDLTKQADSCVQYIQPNPMNPQKKLLIMASCNYENFNKHMYTRKLTIPSYASGIHPHLNKEVIQFNGRLQATNLDQFITTR